MDLLVSMMMPSSTRIFERFQKVHLAAPQATVVGGPNLTCPTLAEFQRASGAVLGSRFAASHCAARYKIKQGRSRVCGEESLISCNLFVARAAVELKISRGFTLQRRELAAARPAFAGRFSR